MRNIVRDYPKPKDLHRISSQAYKSWVRNSFSGELNIGIDPVHITLQSFSKSGTVYCNAKGNTGSNWN